MFSSISIAFKPKSVIILVCFYLIMPYQKIQVVSTLIILTLQDRKLRHWEVTLLSQDYIAVSWWSRYSNPMQFDPRNYTLNHKYSILPPFSFINIKLYYNISVYINLQIHPCQIKSSNPAQLDITYNRINIFKWVIVLSPKYHYENVQLYFVT